MSDATLALVPALPLAGVLVNAVLRDRVDRRLTGAIASGVVGVAAVLSFLVLGRLVARHGEPLHHTLYTWIEVGSFSADVGFLADPLSAVMMCVVTGVGFLIHVYSIGYMDDPADSRSVWRYFAYLNLFIFAMLLLVMGDNLLLMFVGWEGVGLCSYLLIGFWYRNAAFASAGKKAFVVNRVGDLSFVLGMFWLFWELGPEGTLSFGRLAELVAADPGVVGGAGGLAVTAICLLLFGGVTGKSAQIPLFVWLPDAMAGPTPVSALIHAATMVTAGVYMMVRLNFLYALAPAAMGVVALVGASTAFLAATIAVTQFDIKKVLAYSTVSQLGYMVMAVGLGHFVAGFFHVLTHAFFKALLFLGAGAIIHSLHHEQDMRRMGGLRRHMPVTHAAMLVAWLSIIGFPGLSGFWSKDEILWLAWQTPAEHATVLGGIGVARICWLLGVVTAGITAFYMSRLYFMTFWGSYRGGDGHHGTPREAPPVITVPLLVLALLSAVGGLLNLPHWVAEHGWLHHFLQPVVAGAEARLPVEADGPLMFPLMALTLALVAGGVLAAWRLHGAETEGEPLERLLPARLYALSRDRWYVDELYEATIIRPIVRISRGVLWAILDVAIIDGAVNGVAAGARALGRFYARRVQTGQVQAYALAIALGAVVVIACTAG